MAETGSEGNQTFAEGPYQDESFEPEPRPARRQLANRSYLVGLVVLLVGMLVMALLVIPSDVEKQSLQESPQGGSKPATETSTKEPPNDEWQETDSLPTSNGITLLQTCEEVVNCKADFSDRLGHNMPLPLGQAMCNGAYMLGWYPLGNDEYSFRWMDCNNSDAMEFSRFNATHYANLSFVLQPDAQLTIVGSDNHHTGETSVLWSKNCLRSVEPYDKCLHRPSLDCPYIHLRAAGAIVLNYIASHWEARDFHDVYFDLFESTDPSPLVLLPGSDKSDIPSTYCELKYDCLGSRLGNLDQGFVLRAGKAICRGEYMFGWTRAEPWTLQWQNCDTQETKLIFQANQDHNATTSDSPRLHILANASLQVRDDDKDAVWWTQDALRNVQSVASAQCSEDPNFDCPFLHLRQSGSVVVNYMYEPTLETKRRDLDKVYGDDLFLAT